MFGALHTFIHVSIWRQNFVLFYFHLFSLLLPDCHCLTAWHCRTTIWIPFVHISLSFVVRTLLLLWLNVIICWRYACTKRPIGDPRQQQQPQLKCMAMPENNKIIWEWKKEWLLPTALCAHRVLLRRHHAVYAFGLFFSFFSFIPFAASV